MRVRRPTRQSRTPGSVRAKAEWLSYSTTTRAKVIKLKPVRPKVGPTTTLMLGLQANRGKTQHTGISAPITGLTLCPVHRHPIALRSANQSSRVDVLDF